ncbi:MAG TPA: S53 family peptidase [Acidobacteriota bacterium]|nr:S53 family peptidase [Acidobacteriota bacterium]
MPAAKKRARVPGSEKQLHRHAKLIGKVDPQERIEITVLLRPRPSGSQADSHTEDAMVLGTQLPEQRRYLTREEFASARGADPADVHRLENFAHEHNLTVVATALSTRTVKLSGRLADLITAFRPNLKLYRLGARVFRGRRGPITVPQELGGIVVGVFGFDNRPAAKPHHRCLEDLAASPKKRRAAASRQRPRPTLRNAPDGSLTPPQVAQLYDFPPGLDGSGQCIALIELNDFDRQGTITGTGYSSSDLSTYFQQLGLPLPQVTAVGVSGGANMPGPDPNADGEVMLDIEVAGAVAPAAGIAVYFAPNTDQGFLDAINAAVHDTLRKPSVISISWGGPEDSWTDQFRNAFNQAFQDASTLGVTVCCAAGDNGSSDLPKTDSQGRPVRDRRPHVDFPAASPFALACGGTKLTGSGSSISSEVVWNEGDRGGASGGGVSIFFPRPAYQSAAKVPNSPRGKPGRGVPDVAGDADPLTGYQVRVAGKNTVIGGTSAVAPLWAGLLALINQRLATQGKNQVGFINPILYGSPSSFHDIVLGNNDIDGKLKKYKAGKGWDACTGMGSPDGMKVMKLLGG